MYTKGFAVGLLKFVLTKGWKMNISLVTEAMFSP